MQHGSAKYHILRIAARWRRRGRLLHEPACRQIPDYMPSTKCAFLLKNKRLYIIFSAMKQGQPCHLISRQQERRQPRACADTPGFIFDAAGPFDTGDFFRHKKAALRRARVISSMSADFAAVADSEFDVTTPPRRRRDMIPSPRRIAFTMPSIRHYGRRKRLPACAP